MVQLMLSSGGSRDLSTIWYTFGLHLFHTGPSRKCQRSRNRRANTHNRGLLQIFCIYLVGTTVPEGETALSPRLLFRELASHQPAFSPNIMRAVSPTAVVPVWPIAAPPQRRCSAQQCTAVHVESLPGMLESHSVHLGASKTNDGFESLSREAVRW